MQSIEFRDVRWRATAAGVLAIAATGVTTWIALNTRKGQSLDYRGFLALQIGEDGRRQVLSWLGTISVGAIAVACLVCVTVAVARRSIRLAVASVMVIVGANVTTQVLKNVLLERSYFDVWLGYNSLPSGHVTVAASAMCAIYLVAPRAIRPLVALIAATVVTAIGSSTVIVEWHRPADVLASLGVTLAWVAAAIVVIGGVHVKRPLWWRTIVPATLGSFTAAAALMSIGARPADGGRTVVAALIVHGTVALSAAALVVVTEWIAPSRMQKPMSSPLPVGVARPATPAHAPTPA